MTMTISSARDLADWVGDHLGDNVTSAEVDAVCRRLWNHDNCPRWGADWTDFLGSISLDELMAMTESAAQ